MKEYKFPKWCGVFACLCGLGMIALGICRGEMAIVLKKAVNICLECIGIG